MTTADMFNSDPTIDDQLAEFGLSEEGLMEQVIRPAHRAALNVSPLAPNNFAGQTRHAVLVAGLRAVLLSSGSDWIPTDKSGIACVESPSRRLRLMVATGNANTGVRHCTVGMRPSTEWPKGNVLRDLVAGNGGAMEAPPMLFTHDTGGGEAISAGVDRRPPALWILLARAEVKEVRAELAFPLDMDASGFITRWGPDRIFLSPIPNDGLAIDVDDHEDDQDESIDVPVPER